MEVVLMFIDFILLLIAAAMAVIAFKLDELCHHTKQINDKIPEE